MLKQAEKYKKKIKTKLIQSRIRFGLPCNKILGNLINVLSSGKSDLDVQLAMRPTSETVIYTYFAKWIMNHHDLPMKVNQWCNVVRWEFSNPMPFIICGSVLIYILSDHRSRKFYLREGHTAFATKEEADAEVLEILELYRRIYEEFFLAVPVTKGKKSELEKFVGAIYTSSVEESIGVTLMVHGDEKGLVLPTKVASLQIIYSNWEMKGVPLSIEIGPKDLAINQALRQKKLILAPWCDEEEDVKERILTSNPGYVPGDKGAAKTLCTPFYQSEMPKGEEPQFWFLLRFRNPHWLPFFFL
ncbi:hypothetical protein ACOSQ4_003914 [Xanthoceras sorbifolium]